MMISKGREWLPKYNKMYCEVIKAPWSSNSSRVVVCNNWPFTVSSVHRCVLLVENAISYSVSSFCNSLASVQTSRCV